MDIEQIREIIDLMLEKDVAELQLEQHGVTIRVRRPEAQVMAAPRPAAPTAGAPQATSTAPPAHEAVEEEPSELAGTHRIRSPMVGTFYEAPEPEADPFVQVGDRVEEGQTLCIIEAMKLMNEITSDVEGEIVAVLAENGQPVEYGQDLFAIRI